MREFDILGNFINREGISKTIDDRSSFRLFLLASSRHCLEEFRSFRFLGIIGATCKFRWQGMFGKLKIHKNLTLCRNVAQLMLTT